MTAAVVESSKSSSEASDGQSSQGRQGQTLAVSGLPWYLLRQMAAEQQQARQGRRLGPYIVISRQTGAGGMEIAGRLSEQFGWPLLGRELIHQMAERFQADPHVLEMLDETKTSPLYEALGHFVNHHLVSQNAYLRYLRRTIAAAAAEGPAVFVGRGAHFFLPRRHGLAVRVVADERRRIERVAAQEQVSKLEAKRLIQQIDHRRAAYIRAYFHRNIDDAANYDLVVNTSRLGLDAATELVVAAFHAGHA